MLKRKPSQPFPPQTASHHRTLTRTEAYTNKICGESSEHVMSEPDAGFSDARVLHSC